MVRSNSDQPENDPDWIFSTRIREDPDFAMVTLRWSLPCHISRRRSPLTRRSSVFELVLLGLVKSSACERPPPAGTSDCLCSRGLGDTTSRPGGQRSTLTAGKLGYTGGSSVCLFGCARYSGQSSFLVRLCLCFFGFSFTKTRKCCTF